MEKSCGAVVWRDDGGKTLFLILHYSIGHHDFPKGHVEKGESEEETARREILEETGIRELEFDPAFRQTIGYSFRRASQMVKKEVVFFLAKTDEKEVKLSDEHVGFEWLPFDGALSRLTYENGRNLLRKAEKSISSP